MAESALQLFSSRFGRHEIQAEKITFIMTKFVAIAIAILLAIGIAIYFFGSRQKNIPTIPVTNPNTNQIKSMKITSPVFENNANIPAKYTCDGQNINPPLEFGDIPTEAKSLALIMDDPDAPIAGGFVHWVAFNLDPETKTIGENSQPTSGIEGTNSAGKIGYTSPCPPSGTHHYFFKLYALDNILTLDSSAKREDVEKAMEGHILDQTELVGLYKRL
jgi:Raf kinase inhibitor-like YbhB/YbcL family protein